MQLIDSHTHLYLPEFDNDRDELIEKAYQNKVIKMLMPNIDRDSLAPMLDIAEKYPKLCHSMIGLHPTYVKEDYNEQFADIFSYFQKEKFVAIGEIGIDLYWDKKFLKEQIIIFRKQLQMAVDNNLPAVIHCRESYDDVMSVLNEFKQSPLRGVFHAFSGTIDQANEIIEHGLFLGIGGIVTFKNSGLDKVIEKIDPENIILETDSPYLTPAPKRGKRNESSYIIYIAQKIADLKNMPLEQIADISSQNSRELFNLSS